MARFVRLIVSAALCVSAARAQAVVTVTARPTLKYAKKEIWFVSLVNNGLMSATMSREAILQAFPNLSVFPNDLAEDVLTAAAASNPHTWIAAAWNVVSPMAIVALDGTAIETKKNGPLYISGAVAVANLAVQLIGARAPNPSKYFGEILPSGMVTLAPGAGATYGVVTAFSRYDAAQGPFTVKAR
jgi:hypothetical protein